MLNLLIWILILILVMGALTWLIQQIPLDPPFKTGAMLVLAIIFVVLLLYALLGEPFRPMIPR